MIVRGLNIFLFFTWFILFIFIYSCTYSQTGPGGVGSSSSNKLWLKADAITGLVDGNTITTWNDQSGNGNNVSQSVTKRQPTYKTNIINGKPVVYFYAETGNKEDNMTSSFTVPTQNMTIFTVLYHNNPRGPLWVTANSTTNTGFYPYDSDDGYQKLWTGSWLQKTSTFSATTWYSAVVVHGTSYSELWKNGLLSHNNSSNSNTLGTFELGLSGGQYYNGYLAELIHFNYDLNDAERIVVENYLAAKYNLSITNDKFDYQATHPNEVTGIARVDASNTHTVAQSAGIFRVSNASDLGDGEYLLYGHDNGSISSWTTTEAPNGGTNTQRIAREWKQDETGDVGAITISLDPNLLPSLPAGYNTYVVWIDGDGDFSSGATQYPMTLSGGLYIANNINISDANYIAFGIIKPVIEFSLTSSGGLETNASPNIQISLNFTLANNVTVDYSVTGGTASGGGTDYSLASGTATITAGNTTTNITPSVVNDKALESGETIIIGLNNPSLATLGTNTSHTYTINDDDASRTIDFSTSSSNGSESTTTVPVTIRLNTVDSYNSSTVDYSVTGGTATGGGIDFTLTAGTATITAGNSTTTFDITINNDIYDESNETIIITITNPTNAALGSNQVYTYTINDDDNKPNVQFILTSSSNDESVTPANISVTLSALTEQDVTVDYTITGGTATGGGTDYTLAGGTATITAGSTSTNISPTIINDIEIEGNETIVIGLSSPSANATLGTNTSHTYTITDDDNPRKIEFSATGSSGDENTTPATVTVQINSVDNTNPTTVKYTVTGGTATGGGTDYTLANGTATITAGNLSTTFNITIINDFIDEANETIIITLSEPSNANMGTNTTYTYTINDNDASPAIQFGSSSSSASESSGSANIAVSLSSLSGQNVTVDYTVTGGTATGGGTDYTLASGTATITSGTNTTNISITLTNDMLLESGETVIIELSNPSGATLGSTTTHTFTINDDDSNRTIQFSASISNGDEGSTPASLTIEINSLDNVNFTTVDYAVTGGTATGSGTDYTLATGTATISAGNLNTTVNITIVDDSYDESNESIIISLSNPTNSVLGGNSSHTYTINDNDNAPSIQFTATTSGGSENVTPATVQIVLSTATENDVTVDYSVTGGTAMGGGTDYTLSGGTATVTAGNTTTNISISITNDAALESNETIIIGLSGPSANATLGSNTSHTFTIQDDDNDGYNGPGGVGSNTNNSLWLKADAITGLTNGSPLTTWNDASGNGNNASQSNTDRKPTYYTSQVNGKPAVYFDAVTGNKQDFLSTSFSLTNQNMTIFTVFSHSSGTGPLWVTQKNTTNSGFYPYDGTNQKLWTGAVWLSKASTFTAATWYSNVTIHGNSISEVWKDGTLNHNNAANTVGLGTYEIGNGNGVYYKGYIAEMIFYNKPLNTAQRIIVENYLAAKYGITITNDNYAYQATHANYVAGIGRADVTNMHIEAQSAGILKINNATDLSNSEYLLFGHDNGSVNSWTSTEAPSGTQRLAREWRLDETGDIGNIDLSLDISTLPSKPAGYTSYVVWIDSDGDFSGGATQYSMTLSSGSYVASNVSISDGNYVAFGVKKPDIQFSATSSSGAEETTPATVPINISSSSDQDISVDYSVTGGTATGSGTDYTLASGTATITAGNTSTNLSIIINNDVLDENNETVIITLTNPVNANLGTNTQHTFTINDNDLTPTIQFTSTTTMQSETITSANIQISLSAASGLNTSVNYTISGGSATGGGTDYTLADGTANITAGSTTTNIYLTVVNDLLCEGDETIIIVLSSPSNATLGSNTTHTYTIDDNEVCATEWTGSLSTAWNVSGNWTDGVPNASLDVTISSMPSNKPVINTSAECKALTIQSGAKLTIDTSGILTLYGLLTANDSLIIKSGKTTTGSFIDNGSISGTGPYAVKRYITKMCWHYSSSPISNATGAMFNGAGTNKYYYHETNQNWVAVLNTDALVVMRGYDIFIYKTTDKISTFTGSLNTGAKSIVTSNGGQGWNLIGNPYPSAIDWDAASGWTKNNINDAIYFIRNDGNFATYIMGIGTNGGSQYIPAMQGFWIKATASGSVGMTNEVRVHNSQPYQKGGKPKVTYPILRLQVSNNSYTDESIARFVTGSTYNFDGAYDAKKMFSSNKEIPQLYTKTRNSDSLSINTMPTILSDLRIPLNLRNGQTTNYTISVTQIENMDGTVGIFLDDTKIDSTVNMRVQTSYTFSADSGEAQNRFILRFTKPATTTTWLGTTAEWNTANNWSPSGIPGIYSDVIIPSSASNQPVISNNSICNNLTVQAGASLVINNGYTLTVYDDLTLASGASGTSQFLDNGAITIFNYTTVQRYFPKKTWHYVSPPISNANTTMFTAAGNNFYYYDETGEAWGKPATGNLTVMKGYNTFMYYYDYTVLYTGSLNNGAKSISVTKGGLGWNLVGNPYPSAIDWDATSGWTKTGIDNAIYIWDHAQNNYASYIDGVGTNGGSRYIAPGQGFWVKANSPGSVGVTNAVRVINSQPFLKKQTTAVVTDMLKFKVTGNGYYDETVIRFNGTYTDNFDSDCDALKKFSFTYVPQLYTLSMDARELSINSMTSLINDVTIPVYFKSDVAVSYTLKCSAIKTFNPNVMIFLEDLNTFQWIDLSADSTYTFAHNKTNDPKRFLLHFFASTTDIPDQHKNTASQAVNIFSYQNTVYFFNMQNELLSGTAEIVNLLGEKLSEKKLDRLFHDRITLNVSAGYYIVRILTDDSVVSRKIYIR